MASRKKAAGKKATGKRGNRKKGSTRRAAAATSSKGSSTNAAAAVGRALANEALAVRKKQRRRREAAIKRATLQPELVARAASLAPITPRVEALVGTPTSTGVLIAEGDSWFDYPMHDVLSMLEDDHGFDVNSVAHRGDRVEDMAFAPGQFEDFSRHLEKLLRNGKVPKAILLSGGGNDIAGDEFAMLLNHVRSPIGGVNDDVVRGVIDQRIRVSYISLISGVSTIASQILGRVIPILVHGYAHPVPDGRGFLGGFGPLPGPWLRPGFHDRGFDDQAANTATMAILIDRFNDMVSSVADQFDHVHYVDLRDLLMNDSTYRQYWANELHPTERGFRLVTERFAETINAL